MLAPETIEKYSVVSKQYSDYKKYDGKQIVIEAEKAFYKNAYALSSKSDQSTADISPSSAVHSVINHIGGSTWNNANSEIAWKVNVPKDGLYKLGIAFKQSYVTDGDVYRWLKIDGKTPFEEASNISFSYSTKWQFKEFADEKNNDYLIYLTEGEHELSLSVTLSDIAEVFARLQDIVSPLGELYLDIVMITGDNEITAEAIAGQIVAERRLALLDGANAAKDIGKDLVGLLFLFPVGAVAKYVIGIGGE